MKGAGAFPVRPLTADHAQQYRALRLANLRDFQFAHGPDYEESLAKTLAWHGERLAKPAYHWFGAFAGMEDDAPLAGAVCLRTREGRRLSHAASMHSLMVASSHQGAGIGRLLVGHAIGFARSLRSIRQITLAVVDGNVPALRLYDSFGFKQFGLEPDAIYHEGRYCATQHLLLSLVSPDAK